ncbi:MAG: cation:proton antiporter [Clostridia bacterium]|nr:cation:proton antiporter [Clostridia bacterium]
MDYKYLLDIGLIILFVKLFSMITGKIHMPKMLGGLIAGVVLGPAIFNIIQSNPILEFLANLGIIFIMFLAGMETSLKKFMAGTKKFVIIASIGVIIPLLFGFLFSKFYTLDNSLNLFFGIVITATSVSITVESLIEMKKLKTNVGTAILGAGVVDDIIGVVFLTLILNNGNFSFISICLLVIKVIIFFAIAIALRSCYV